MAQVENPFGSGFARRGRHPLDSPVIASTIIKLLGTAPWEMSNPGVGFVVRDREGMIE